MLKIDPRAWTMTLALTFLAPAALSAAEIHVKIDNFAFVPADVVVHSGDSVVWENVDDIPHSIVSVTPSAFRSKALDTNDTFSKTFSTPGLFDYFCGLHSHMKGKVTVAP